jgi:hypothetical protein
MQVLPNFGKFWDVVSFLHGLFNSICSRTAFCEFPFNGPKIFRVKTSVIYLLILTLFLFPQSFSIILLIENVQTVTVSFENEIFSICVLIYGQTVENYREIHHFLALIKVLINQHATSTIVVFCMTYCLYTVKWKQMKLGKTTDQKNTFRTTAMLILIMLIFVLGNIPSTVKLCFDAFGFRNGSTKKLWFIVQTSFSKWRLRRTYGYTSSWASNLDTTSKRYSVASRLPKLCHGKQKLIQELHRRL